MTLILSISTPRASVHASDRRVTLAGSGVSPVVYSPLENKTLIFLAADAVGTIGFTGIAFVGKQPTDQWIANTLAPQPAGAPPLGTFAFGGRGLGRVKLRTIIWSLRNALAGLPRNLGKYGLTLQVAGYRIRRRLSIPFCVQIDWKGGVPTVNGWMRPPRTRQQRILFSQAGDGWPIARTSKVVMDHAEATGRRDIEALRLAAMDAIRQRAGETATVGRDLMTVIVPNPFISREILWRFEPADPHEAAIVGANVSEKFQAIYSPWIITPASVSCPTVGTSGLTVGFGGFEIKCENDAANPDSPLRFAASHQQRSRPPG